MSRKPHVVHFLYGFGPGGSEIRTAIYMNGLGADYRHTLLLRRHYVRAMDLLDDDVEADVIDLDGLERGPMGPFRLAALIRRLDPDLLCVYNWVGIEGGIAAILRGIAPWITILDGFGAEEADAQLRRRRIARRFVYSRADAVVCVSHGLATLARDSWKVDPRRVLHIRNGIDTTYFTPGSGADARRQLGLSDDDILVGMVAHIRPEKDPERLLAAFARVAPDFPKAHLAFVGATRYVPGLHDRLLEAAEAAGVSDRVHFSGVVKNPREYYRAFDLFALASRTEQMPMSVAEAMACGKPILSTDVGDVRHMVAPANQPFVVPRADIDGYAAALARLLAEPETRRELGEANRAVAERDLDRGRMVDEYRALFDRLVGERRRSPRRSLAAHVKAFVHRAGSTALYYTGILDLVSWCRRRFRNERSTILSFHCVSDSSRPERRYFRPGMNIDSHRFRALLVSLRRKYRLLSLDDAVRALAAPSPGERAAVAITFDDGYRSVYQNAFPILRELNVPATVFLPTAYIGTDRLLWWDEVHHLVESAPEKVLPLLAGVVALDSPSRSNEAVSHMKYLARPERDALLSRMRAAAGPLPPPDERVMMNWDEVREMHAAGIRFGSHTVSHRYLDALDRAALREELRGAREEIERRLGVAPRAVAYPDGRFNAIVVEEAQAAGYECAVSTITGINDSDVDLFALRRQDGGVPAGTMEAQPSFPVMWAELLGVWDLLFLRRRRVPERFSSYRPRVKGPGPA